MPPTQSDASRLAKLNKLFTDIIHGKREVKTANTAKLFLEAICAQENASSCVERLLARKSAMEALRASLRVNVSIDFLNSTTTSFIQYLTDPSVKQIANGRYLQDILELLIDPPTLWNALVAAYKARSAEQDLLYAYGWLISETISLPSLNNPDFLKEAERVVRDELLVKSPSHELRILHHKIEKIQSTLNTVVLFDTDYSPGGRHDNDFAEYRKIAIFPTADEFISSETPFYRQADALYEVEPHLRASLHLDNQFRLLREDLLAQLREGLNIATGRKKGKRRSLILGKFTPLSISNGVPERRKPCSIALQCQAGLEQLMNVPVTQRKEFLKKTRSFLKHQSFGCLINGKEIVAFATVNREDEDLVKKIPVVHLQIRALRQLQFVLVDTPFFAFEPILKCLQEKTELPFVDELFTPASASGIDSSHVFPQSALDELKTCSGRSIKQCLKLSKDVILEKSQMDSMISGLKGSLSLIQGPPGTGKSFIGALLAQAIHHYTKETILVICFTNYALDQFLEDFLDIGILPEHMVRLGSKSTTRTSPLNLSAQKDPSFRSTRESWSIKEATKSEASVIDNDLKAAFETYRGSRIDYGDLVEYLQFSDDEQDIYEALQTPEDEDGMTIVDRNGKSVRPSYLFDRWSKGEDAGIFKAMVKPEHQSFWTMEPTMRQNSLNRWVQAMLQDQITNVCDLKNRYDKCHLKLDEMFAERKRSILKSKRIIGCTTTAAAMHSQLLQSVSPGVILVEEAGEILESHILATLSAKTKKLVMIGDHKQLRPRVSNYALTAERGDGFDLNVSLFERLVHAGYPTTTLSEQHRMNLRDAPKTLTYPNPRGLQDRVIFFNHDHKELPIAHGTDSRDQESKSSKQNWFEVEMVLKTVKYLAQQGYGTDRLVVLTPYLGQLYLLKNTLSADTNPVLNDLDSADLVQAGLVTHAAAKSTKQPLRIATIDNYQGEESDIVICSLTRSNDSSDVEFMAEPQRLNVLLSRAKVALIMIGNAKTFKESKKGKKTWTPFFEYITEHHHMYDGLPVQCEQHPNRKTLLKSKEDFVMECPDGGCDQPCGTTLNCGLHDCPHRCHQLSDHSKMNCLKILESTCSRNHTTSSPCHQRGGSCRVCRAEDEKKEKKRLRDHRLEMERLRKQQEYEARLQNLQDEIDVIRRLTKDKSEESDRNAVLRQRRMDLENAKRMREAQDSKPPTSPAKQSVPFDEKVISSEQQPSRPKREEKQSDSENHAHPATGEAKSEWNRQKRDEGADNEALDSLMQMIGLEDVKEKFLSIKSKVDTAIRQGVDMKEERFSAALLGNPGTGKTTVARLYAKFLTSVGALPGSHFVETTGSRLSNDGVPGCKKIIEDIQEKGGGVMFIDEAYQLTSGNSAGGKQVLDFLLAEVENLRGKVVFVIAGYNKQMETFFAHNPGIPSRFPESLQFNDYEDADLQRILIMRVTKKYSGNMTFDDGPGGLYVRIVARRIGRGRGKAGFGNAREVENVLSKITERQANRLRLERKNGMRPDDLYLSREDLIGPEPSTALRTSKAWSKLHDLIGLQEVKDTVQALFESIQYNYEREIEEAPIMEYTLNRIFLGSPGTGKTSVAKIYGQILADIGMLSNGEVVIKNPSDFTGSVLGESEKLTKGILESTIGKVLIIDEAYGLSGSVSSNGSGGSTDIYKVAVIDTIVAEVQSTAGEDRCVLLLGYNDQMESMLQNVNPGLMRRFPLSSAFKFADFTDEEMSRIFDLKLKQIGFKCNDQSKKVALEVLQRARNRPNFGNAGEVDILLNVAKSNFQQHRSKNARGKKASIFEPQDFDKEFDRGEKADTNIQMLFKDDIGNPDIIAKLEGYQKTYRNAKKFDLDPREQLPFNFLFRGPPGTGKTTTARKMGQIYYDMGFLASAEVLEKSATDMIGQYVGQTGPKTVQLLEKALGKILLIDEAYRLAEGNFAKEAMDEIVDCITKPRFARKLIIILAGYDADINRLMAINPGLTSRFPASLTFNPLNPNDCLILLTKILQKRKDQLVKNGKGDFDISLIQSAEPSLSTVLLDYLRKLLVSPNWANARDIQTLAGSIFGKVLNSDVVSNTFVLDKTIILGEFQAMLDERLNRSHADAPVPAPQAATPVRPAQEPPRPATSTSQKASTATKSEVAPQSCSAPPNQEAGTKRDAGVSDETWETLQQDQARAEAQAQTDDRLLQHHKQLKEAADAVKKDAETDQLAAERKQNNGQSDNDNNEEEKRRREQERLERLRARQAILEEVMRIEMQKKLMEERRKKEAENQQKLSLMGVCEAGFRWIKQSGGYRCAGGYHFVSNAQLEG